MQTNDKSWEQEEQSHTGVSRFHSWLNLSVLAGLALLLILLYSFWTDFGWGVRHVASEIMHGDLEGLKSYLLSFGTWAPVIAGLVMVLQAVVAPLPAFVPALANGLLFGAFWGTLLTWSTSVIGSLICFYIARSLGRPAVEKLVSFRAMNSVDRFFKRYGNNSILIARLIPLFSFSAISYVSGVTSVSFRGYLWATAIGILPGTIVFCVLGNNMTDLVKFVWYAITGVTALLVLGFSVRRSFNKRLESRAKYAAGTESLENHSGIVSGK